MSCPKTIEITIGDQMKGVLQLRKQVNGVINPYPIPSGATVELHFPAFDTSAPVVLSTANSGEVTIVDATLSTISFVGAPAKSLLLNEGKMQRIDVVITDTAGNPFTLTSGNILNISQRANA